MGFTHTAYSFAAGAFAIAVQLGPVGTAPVNTFAPVIGPGSVTPGNDISIEQPGVWTGDPEPEVTNQWQADGVDIPGANSTSLSTNSLAPGQVVVLKQTGTNIVGSVDAFSNEALIVE